MEDYDTFSDQYGRLRHFSDQYGRLTLFLINMEVTTLKMLLKRKFPPLFLKAIIRKSFFKRTTNKAKYKDIVIIFDHIKPSRVLFTVL